MGLLTKLMGTETTEEKINRLWESAKKLGWSDEECKKKVGVYAELLGMIDEHSTSFNVCSIYRNRAISYRSLKNFDEAINDLSRELEIARRRDDSMRVMDCQKVTEETQAMKRKAEIESGGGEKAAKIKAIGELEFKLWGSSPEADKAFETLFAELESPDPDVRAEASRLLADPPKSAGRLITIYEQCLRSDPHRAHLAGRVLGRKMAKGIDHMIQPSIAKMMYGLNVSFIPCGCVFCGHFNKGIPAPPNGPMVPYYHQEDDKGAYAVSVLCDQCGKKFFVVWDSDPW
jgi:tetratricopeptide (TPR) repeat protein